MTERTWRGSEEFELLPVRLPLDGGVDLDDTQSASMIQIFALLFRIQSLGHWNNDRFLPISRDDDWSAMIEDGTLLPPFDDFGGIELALLESEEHENELDAKEDDQPPPNPPPALIDRDEPGSDGRHC